ncbi:MAG: diacylglycerol kinase family protein [Acidobacteriota bacterium]
MRSGERILVILNPSSGVVSKDVAASYIFKKLTKSFDTVSLINSNSPEDGYNIAKKGLDSFDVITAFGGDGTINSIASALVGTDKTLGILPGGSGNGLIRNLKISLSWRSALDTLINGKDKYIDIGKINNSYFFNVAGVGLDGFISKKFNLESKTRGITPYIYYALKGYFEMPSFKVKINSDDIEFDEEIMLIAFANFQQYGGNAIIAPFADPFDGYLDLCIIKNFKFVKSALNLKRVFNGNIHKFPFYNTFKFKKAHIEAIDIKIPSTIDGEYGGEDRKDYLIEVVPKSIKIRTPGNK